MATLLLELHRMPVSDHIRSRFDLRFSIIVGGSDLRGYEIIIILFCITTHCWNRHAIGGEH